MHCVASVYRQLSSPMDDIINIVVFREFGQVGKENGAIEESR